MHNQHSAVSNEFYEGGAGLGQRLDSWQPQLKPRPTSWAAGSQC